MITPQHIPALPTDPGVYKFTNKQGKPLYIGKANNLRSRVRSYLSLKNLEPAKREMIRRATDIDVTVVRNEQEALALEASLIRKHKPTYNIRFVDDSSYYYIKITNNRFPTVQLVRTVQQDGAWYRGPFPSSRAVKSTLKTARKFFPWCQYADPSTSKGQPCFAYHIRLCPGICIGAISEQEYRLHMKRLAKFLDGKVYHVRAELKKRMTKLSSQQKYEQAGALRDQIRAIERTMAPQSVVTTKKESADVIGMFTQGTRSAVAVTSVRDGCVTNTVVFYLIHPATEQQETILREFIAQYTDRSPLPSLRFILPFNIQQVRRNVAISVPMRGWKRELIDIAKANAKTALERNAAELETSANIRTALIGLARVMGLRKPPKHIEAYDISAIQGTLATASRIVFKNGKPAPSQYRKFKIKKQESRDDTRMMEEVLERRLRNASSETLPDLILLDGGKGQLGAGLRALRATNLSIPIAALAKQNEELFLPRRRDPISLPLSSPTLYLLQRIRDEAHRFTVSYHRLLRKKRMTRSVLEDIPGIGPVTRKRLLRTFGSLQGIRSASKEDIEKVVGEKKGALLREALHI